MSRFVYRAALVVLAVWALSSCGSLRKSGSPERVSKRYEVASEVFRAKLDSARFRPEQYGFKAKAVLVQGERETRFRIEVRIERGKRIWVNVSDPVLGISVARLLLSPDSAVMYNKLERSYLAGSPEELSRSLGLHFSYGEIEDLLLVNVPTFEKEAGWLQGEEGHWMLDSTRQGAIALESGLLLRSAEVDDRLLRPVKLAFVLKEPRTTLHCSFSKETAPSDARFPLDIAYAIGLPYRTALRLEIEEVQTRVAGFPFAVPEGYRKGQ